VGTYIALLVLNRVVARAPSSGFSDWWATTAGDRLVHLNPEALRPPALLTPWTKISAASLPRSNASSSLHGRSFGIDCSGLVLDMTNFATYIDSANDKGTIAGVARQAEGTDLRLSASARDLCRRRVPS